MWRIVMVQLVISIRKWMVVASSAKGVMYCFLVTDVVRQQRQDLLGRCSKFLPGLDLPQDAAFRCCDLSAARRDWVPQTTTVSSIYRSTSTFIEVVHYYRSTLLTNRRNLLSLMCLILTRTPV